MLETTGARVEKLLLRIPEVAEALGIGRSSVYELTAAGEIPVIHIGRSVRVPADGLRTWAERLAAEQAGE